MGRSVSKETAAPSPTIYPSAKPLVSREPRCAQLKNESLEAEVARLEEELEAAQAKRARLSKVGSPPDALAEPPVKEEEESITMLGMREKESSSQPTSASPSLDSKEWSRNRRFSTHASRMWRVDDVVKAARAAEKAKAGWKGAAEKARTRFRP